MMWTGYYTNIGSAFSRFMRNIGYKKWWRGEINITRLWVIVIFGYLIKLYLFSIGLHGRLIDEDYFEQGAGYKLGSQIRVLGELSLLTFIFVSYLYFKSKGQAHRILFFGCLAAELFFAFLSGARAPFLFPFVIIFFVYYYLNERIKLSMVFLVIIPIIISFTYVASFKSYVLSRAFERSGNPIEVIADYQEFMSKLDTRTKENVTSDVKDKIIESTNFVCEGAAAIWYKDTKGLDSKSPDFKLWLLKSPIDAFVPLFLQPVKNIPAYGLWFKNQVLRINKALYYSIATSHVGYFYLTGGIIMILIGFFVFGIIVKIIYNLLFEGVIALAIFIMCYSFLIGSDIFSTLIVYFFRTMFIYPILVWILYSKWGLVWKKESQPKLSPSSI